MADGFIGVGTISILRRMGSRHRPRYRKIVRALMQQITHLQSQMKGKFVRRHTHHFCPWFPRNDALLVGCRGVATDIGKRAKWRNCTRPVVLAGWPQVVTFPGLHKSVLAQLRHTARQVTVSLRAGKLSGLLAVSKAEMLSRSPASDPSTKDDWNGVPTTCAKYV